MPPVSITLTDPKNELIVGQLDTIIDFDRIAVLDAGCLVEFDTPQNLLARESLFKQMYSGNKQEF
jgi:ABC-type multidrug transport system fused ATPase/permease subunit